MQYDISEFINYRRELIALSKDIVIMLHIFDKRPKHKMEDFCVLEDNEEYFKTNIPDYRNAAKQFMKQFEGEDCAVFWKILKDEIEEKYGK